MGPLVREIGNVIVWGGGGGGHRKGDMKEEGPKGG